MKVNGQHYDAAKMAIMQFVAIPTEEVLPMLAKLFRNMEAKGAREALAYQARMVKEMSETTTVNFAKKSLLRVHRDIQKRLEQLGEV